MIAKESRLPPKQIVRAYDDDFLSYAAIRWVDLSNCAISSSALHSHSHSSSQCSLSLSDSCYSLTRQVLTAVAVSLSSLMSHRCSLFFLSCWSDLVWCTPHQWLLIIHLPSLARHTPDQCWPLILSLHHRQQHSFTTDLHPLHW